METLHTVVNMLNQKDAKVLQTLQLGRIAFCDILSV